ILRRLVASGVRIRLAFGAWAGPKPHPQKGGSIMLLGLRTAKYHVDDVERGRDWYTRALGVQPYFDQPFYVGFNVGGFELGLDPDPRPGKEAGAGGVDVYWGVADIQAGLAHFLAAGATKLEDVQDVGDGIKVAMVHDPFGNRFGLIENPHFGK